MPDVTLTDALISLAGGVSVVVGKLGWDKVRGNGMSGKLDTLSGKMDGVRAEIGEVKANLKDVQKQQIEDGRALARIEGRREGRAEQ